MRLREGGEARVVDGAALGAMGFHEGEPAVEEIGRVGGSVKAARKARMNSAASAGVNPSPPRLVGGREDTA